MPTLEAAFAALSNDFIEGDFSAAIDRFNFPMAIYAESKVIVCEGPESLFDAMSQYYGMLRSAGARSVDVRVAAHPLMRGASGTIWLEKTYRDAEGDEIDTCKLRYFFRLERGRPVICMVEYLKVPQATAARCIDIHKAA